MLLLKRENVLYYFKTKYLRNTVQTKRNKGSYIFEKKYDGESYHIMKDET